VLKHPNGSLGKGVPQWDWDYLSSNPNITWEHVVRNPNKSLGPDAPRWNWLFLSKNKFKKLEHL
jgi:hypothetical protein